MRATARLVAEADAGGATRLAVLRSQAPLLLRRTGPRRTGPPLPPEETGQPYGTDLEAQVHLVGGAAGPLGGDQLRIEIEVGAAARLCVRTVAASIALPGRGGGRSQLEIHARVAPGGLLRWQPEPLIAAARCDHLSLSTVDLAEGAALVWRDELVCGRHGEAPGDARVATTLRYAGRTLYRHELSVGPAAPGWAGPAVLGGAGAVGSLLIVDPAWAVDGQPPAQVLGPAAALMPLADGPGVLATVVGPEHRAVRACLDGVPYPQVSRLRHPVDVVQW